MMYKKIKPFFIIVETPLHAGSGTDLGIIDMPIQREKHTEFPKIEASGLKGCIREAFESNLIKLEIKEKDQIKIQYKLQEKLKVTFGEKLYTELSKEWKKDIEGKKEIKLIKYNESVSLAFGPENGDDHAGALGLTDARLLLFPVKSMKGIFAWITCPRVLERFRNDLKLCGITDFPQILEQNSIPSVPTGSQLIIKDNSIVLEEYTFKVSKDTSGNGVCSKLADWFSQNSVPNGAEYKYWKDKIKNDIVVLKDDDFKDFVNLSTEVITRIKINNETGTVQQGALFTEEYLPTETILYSLALTTPIFKEKEEEKGIFAKTNGAAEEDLVLDYFVKGLPSVIQIGGNSTIGKGIVRIKIWGDTNGK